jgi:CRP/FNR family nitrogen fixation transcriptional regulator
MRGALGKIDVYQDLRRHPLAIFVKGAGPMLVNANCGPLIPSKLSWLSHELVIANDFRYRRGAELFGEAEAAEFVYQIIKGAVRSYKLLADGRRQISAFHLPGDMFGFENGDRHRFTAEAIVETSVRVLKRRSVEAVAQRDSSVTEELLRLTAVNLEHAEEHMLLLGRKTSLERVAAFLVEMDRRLTAAGVMELPMSRRDIADYLGLTLETVSRALSILHSEEVIAFLGKTQRQILVLDRNKLAQLDTI